VPNQCTIHYTSKTERLLSHQQGSVEACRPSRCSRRRAAGGASARTPQGGAGRLRREELLGCRAQAAAAVADAPAAAAALVVDRYALRSATGDLVRRCLPTAHTPNVHSTGCAGLMGSTVIPGGIAVLRARTVARKHKQRRPQNAETFAVR